MRFSFLNHRFFSAAVMMLVANFLLIPAVLWAQNSAPIVDAGEDQTILMDTGIRLQGTATDPDDDPIVGWLWAVDSAPSGSTPLIEWPDQFDPLFFADLPGDYILALIASDGTDWSAPDTVTIHVIDPATLPPTANAGMDQHVSVDGVALLRGSATDILNRPIIDWLWAVESMPAGSTPSISHPSSPTTRFSAEETGEYVLSLIASNGVGWSEPDLISIFMEETSNHPPLVDAGEDQTILMDTGIRLQGTATDPDDDPIVGWLWAVDSAPSGSTPLIEWPDQFDPLFFADLPGDYILALIASDGTDWSQPDFVTITVTAENIPESIPTLSEWGMIIFFALLVAPALWIMMRRRGEKSA